MSQSDVCLRSRNGMSNNVNPGRRAFLKTAALAGGATIITGIPLASYFIAPAMNKGTGKWADFGNVEDLEPNNVLMLSYEFLIKDGWLVLPQRSFVWAKTEADDKLTIFSSICTHLSCNVIWQEEAKVFECPCHAGRFDINGQPTAGPPPKPLPILEHKVEDGKLLAFLAY